MNDIFNFVYNLNIDSKLKNILWHYVLLFNKVNLNSFEFCSTIDRKYSVALRNITGDKIQLKKECYYHDNICDFCMILSVCQADMKYVYLMIDGSGNVEVLSKKQLISKIDEFEIMIAKDSFVSKCELIPGIDTEYQINSNKDAYSYVLPEILKKVLSDSVTSDNISLIKK